MAHNSPEQAQNHGWGRRLARAALLLFNLLLLLILIGQGALIVWLWPNGEVSLPVSLLDKVNDALAKDGLHFEAQSIDLDLRGYIAARDVTLGLIDGEKEAFTAEQVLIGFKPWELLIGRFTLDELRLIKGQLDCPPVLSPTGVRETIIQNIYLSAKSRQGNWQVEKMTLNAAGFRLALNGGIPRALLKAQSSPRDSHTDVTDIQSGYQELCRAIMDVETKTQDIQSPLLLFELSPTSKTTLGVHTTFITESYHDPSGASIGPSLTQANLTLGPDLILRSKAPATAVVHDLDWPDQASCDFAQLQFELSKGAKGVLVMPDTVTIFLYNLNAQGLTFDGALVLADLRKNPIIGIHVGVKDDLNWFDLSGTTNLTNQTANFEISGRWDPQQVMQLKSLSEVKMPKIDFKERPRIHARARLDNGWRFNRCWLQVESGPVTYETLAVEYLFTNALITGEQMTLKDTRIRTADYTVTGGYEQDFTTGDYRILLKGGLRPLDISFIINEKWWDDLWGEFTFDKELPQASLDLTGQYDADDEVKMMYVQATVPECHYRGLAIKRASAYLSQVPSMLNLMDLYIESDQGNTLANLQWRYVPHGKDQYSLAFTGNSSMPPQHICQLVGPDAEPYGSFFTSETPPRTQAAGLIYGEDSPHNGDLYLNIAANFPQSVVFEGITFGRLQFDLYSQPDKVTMRGIDGLLANGTLTGDATLTLSAPQKLDLDLDLKQASLLGMFTDIPELKAIRESGAAAQDKEDEEQDKVTTAANGSSNSINPFAGMLDMDFKGSGDPDDGSSFSGAGKASLTGAQLGRLHLFGGLSRLTDKLGIGLGTLDFTSAKLDYDLSGSVLHIPKAEITGSTARVEANGYYQMAQDNLNFVMTLYPLGGISVPVVSTVLSVLNPISNTIEVNLKGPINDPKWSTSFGIMRAFTGQNQVQNPNGNGNNTSNSRN